MKQRGGVAIFLWLLLVIACGFTVERSKFSTDLSAFLPSHPDTTQQLFMEQLRNGVASRMILIAIEGADPQTRAALSRDLARRLRAETEFVSISNGGQTGLDRDREFLFANRYRLSPAVTPQRFTAAGLHDAIEESIDFLASPAGLLIKPLLTRDPTGETLQLLELFDQGNRPSSTDGAWVSRDGRRAILLAQTRAVGSDIDGQQRAVTLIHQAFDQAQHENGAAATARLEMTGPGAFSVVSRDTIKREVTHLSIIATLIVTTLLFVVYRSLTALVLGMLPIATGILAGIAAVSLGFGMVHGVTLGFGITLIGEAVDYSIYLFIQSRHDTIGRGWNETWTRTFWPTIRLGVMTSVIGFAALLFSGFPGLAQLGLYSTAGLTAAAVVTRFVLPSLLPRGFHIRDVSSLGNTLAWFSRHAIPLRWLIAIMVAASCTVIYINRHDIWNADLADLSPISSADRALDASLRGDLGAPDPRYLIIVSADGMDAALANAENVASKLNALVDDGVIAGYDSPSRYLPSLATQKKRQEAIPDKRQLSSRLRTAVTGLPIRAERLAGFIDDTQAARRAKPLQRNDLTGTSLATVVDAMLINHGRQWSALLPLRAPVNAGKANGIDTQRIRAALTGPGLSRAAFVDIRAELNMMYSGYLHEAITLSLGGSAAIAVLLLIVMRSPLRVVRVLLPLVMAVVTVAAGLLANGQHLTILHLVGMLLIAAVGSNYALFFDRRSHYAATRDSSGTLASLLFANLTTVIVFGLLALSSVPVLKFIGETVAPGVVLALLFSAVLTGRPKNDLTEINWA